MQIMHGRYILKYLRSMLIDTSKCLNVKIRLGTDGEREKGKSLLAEERKSERLSIMQRCTV